MPHCAPMRIDAILFSQGFGTRRECAALVAQGLVRVAGRVLDDPGHECTTDGLVFEVQGQPWPYRDKALLMLHKPAGHECSQRPGAHPSVMALLPPPLRRRGVQPVGRLDVDTTGLLLLTDDGALLHRLTSPKHHVPKVYEAGVKHALDHIQIERLLQGVVLADDPVPVRAAAARAQAPHLLELTLTEGKYHQVKRMVAAVGNRVETLHRSRFGALALPAGLAPGQWCWVAGPHAIGAAPHGAPQSLQQGTT
jgi:16S rRNA pseudouridine516 synthase